MTTPAEPLTRRARREAERAAAQKPSRAGRDLPAAIAVGLVLLGVVLVGLLFYPLAFVLTVAGFGAIGCWEVARAFRAMNTQVPFVPLAVGAVAMPCAAHFGGAEALGFALASSLALAALWRLIEGGRNIARSVLASAGILLWVPLLLSFAILLFALENGAAMVATMLLLTVANDTFGYIVGVLFGKHPMAPKISPKKSWEGFAGSVVGASAVAVASAILFLDMPWWMGIPLAVATVAAATAGDLAESMVKRELSIKDMSNLLPGHGGVMDRLDSILFAAPAAYLMAVLLAQ